MNINRAINDASQCLFSEAKVLWKNISPVSMSSLSIFRGISYFAEHEALTNLIPSEIKSVAEHLNASNALGDAMNILDFIFTVIKIPKNIKEREKANKSGDSVKILDADLTTIKITGKCLNFSAIFTNFVTTQLSLPTLVSGLASAVGKVCSVASMVFSFAEIVQHKLHYSTTHQFMGELKRQRHLTFLETYFEKMQITPKDSIKTLSSDELKTRVKTIKSELKDAKNDTLLTDITKVANQAFVNALTDKMSADPGLFSQHFNAQIRKSDSPKKNKGLFVKLMPPNPKLTANFKEKLSSLAANGEAEKLSSAVKLLKNQGRCTERSHIFSMALSSINCTNSIARFALATITPIIIPISVGIWMLTSGASIIQHVVNKEISANFVNSLEKTLE